MTAHSEQHDKNYRKLYKVISSEHPVTPTQRLDLVFLLTRAVKDFSVRVLLVQYVLTFLDITTDIRDNYIFAPVTCDCLAIVWMITVESLIVS